jgi:hypothetical protein
MAGNPAFQASPHAFRDEAFQSGVMLVAPSVYDLGSPSFATPGPLSFKYVFSSPAYSLGSPAFATPGISVFIGISSFTANAYSLGALTFALPSMIRKVALSGAPLTLSSPAFATPGPLVVKYRLFSNAWAVGPLAFAAPPYQFNFILTKPPDYSLGPLAWAAVGPFQIQARVLADAYWLSVRFAAPRLQTEVVALDLPPPYFTQVEEATNVLVGMLNRLMSSIPPSPTPARDNLRILVGLLRSNAAEAIRGTTLGTQLQRIFMQADPAGATFPGLETVREYLMSHASSTSIMTHIVLRVGLIMTLGLEAKVVARMTFKTRDDAQQMILRVRHSFELAKAFGIDDLDALVYQTFNAMSGALINHLSLTALKLPRFVAWESKAPMPSLYLANRIYADASRSDEIEQENQVVNPCFVPINIRILSYPPTWPR